MKQKRRFITLIILIICVITACSIPFASPDGGKFYCEELQMTLDFSSRNNEAIFTEDGNEVTGHFKIGYYARIYVEYVENTTDGLVFHNVLSGKFKYKSDIIIIKTDDEDEYIFLPIVADCSLSLIRI